MSVALSCTWNLYWTACLEFDDNSVNELAADVFLLGMPQASSQHQPDATSDIQLNAESVG